MKRTQLGTLAVLLGLCCAPGREAGAQNWLISGSTGQLFDYTQGSGAATNPRLIAAPPAIASGALVAGIDFSPSGTLYALTTAPDNSLYTVNPTTGAATSVPLSGPTLPANITEGDLAFDPTSGLSPGGPLIYGLYDKTGLGASA